MDLKRRIQRLCGKRNKASLNRTRPSLSLCESFIGQAKKIWNLLNDANSFSLNLREDSITDWNLLELYRMHPLEIIIKTFSSVEEGTVGADWEWWLNSQDFWLGFRVQAKKLDYATLKYKQLDRTNNRGRQIDLLIESALNDNLIPLYIFYNYWDVTRFDPEWLCETYNKDIKMLGCGLSYAECIRDILNAGDKNLQAISKVMYPWSCLVCCRFFSTKEDKNLPNRAFDFIKGAFENKIRDKEKEFPSNKFISSEPPSYISKIMNEKELSKEEQERVKVKRIIIVKEKKSDL
ncbi:hypothetical protein COY52_04350 [Candidatus Desantisbacteria bacterium CG_4_10_14_0_8_um_filter_48_22]|uniref:Uncharacterized protein n=1 Tax=Candidatus Desantisbacteria bacterium CG_4_10_14_0_8_um_filter_48_22 TaxID=1974543 RepID=A0A2M7SD99_9BACT|nr:MAG: hypothetical protein COS16_04920 [Candidatus Desantisbacteria bacterium CG02_land_8_20_14_3_00_49_13]PIZ17502.1 MAG: hypothetical protein COY52_04350 [Candidatus Desantisbacteria bacterium CG_4_10_14_0_8_um_filter_48_22]